MTLTAAVVGTGVAILAVLVPLLLALHRETAVRLADLGDRLARVEQRLGDQGERLARIEGAGLGPWRPEQAAPAPE